MKKGDKKQRALMYKAMDYIVRCVNSEDYIDTWFMCGVADGDINDDTTIEEIMCDDYYMDAQNFSEIMGLFLRIMSKANKDGGLYAGGVTSKDTY